MLSLRINNREPSGLNAAETAIIGCHISDIKTIGQDSQAIAGWKPMARTKESMIRSRMPWRIQRRKRPTTDPISASPTLIQ